MFGFVVADRSKMTQEQLNRYQSCYCGLCRCIGVRHGNLQRAALNYDMTFLVLLLSSLYEPEEDIVEERYFIDEDERRREYVMLGLRLAEGICDAEYREMCGRGMLEDMPMIEKFLQAGYLERFGDRVAFSDEGFFVSNAILAELLN